MKYLFLLLLLSGCSDHYKCVDGELWHNVYALPKITGNVYIKSNPATKCKDEK